MLFNSYIFIFLFLPITLLGYFSLNKLDFRWGKTFLVLMSFVFYGYFNAWYLLLIVGSILVNFAVYKFTAKHEDSKQRKVALALGIFFNVGLIFYYKYYDFFISNINAVFGTHLELLHLLLPLGISFFTFQQLSFVVDAYRKQVGNIDLLDYSLFVTYFPQLIAGPIVLHNEMIPQFADESNKKLNCDNLVKGIMVFTMGLSKKLLIADTLSDFVTSAFAGKYALGSLDWILIMLAYTFQIYFDFSGYSDMAIGLGKMFNIRIVINFNSPYKALDIMDFWKRWHLTLTRFLRTYVYFPLGGNRVGTLRAYLNILIVFFVSGVWHGANWTFILWGVAHGAMSVFTRALQKPWRALPKALQWLATFTFVNFAWLLFRSDSIVQFINICRIIFTGGSWRITENFAKLASYLPEFNFISQCLRSGYGIPKEYTGIYLGIILFLCLVVCLFCKNSQEFKYEINYKTMFLTAFFLVYSIISLSKAATFLYFNF